MSMSRDGLLPARFGKINARYQTPGFATILTGVIVGVGALFLQSGLVTDLTSIGTLFAFVLVCGGVLLLPKIEKKKGQFNLPYINGQFWVPALVLVFFYLTSERLIDYFSLRLNQGDVPTMYLLFFLAALMLTIVVLLISVFSIAKKPSLIPILGMVSCLYLMLEIPTISWSWFFVWMGLGLILYFSYGFRNSKLK
jgi:amino acid transporter